MKETVLIATSYSLLLFTLIKPLRFSSSIVISNLQSTAISAFRLCFKILFTAELIYPVTIAFLFYFSYKIKVKARRQYK